MKRLGRLGSVAFLTITISLVFHLIGMSYDHWIDNVCRNCNNTDPLASWTTSLRQRCYEKSVPGLFIPINSPDFQSFTHSHSFIADICIPNQILIAKSSEDGYDCLLSTFNYTPHIICAINHYDQNKCRCDYTSRTKGVLSLTVLTALSLGVMVFLSHSISFVKQDYILRWLFPLSFGLLIFAIVCIVLTLITFSATKYQDISEVIYRSSLLSAAFRNVTLVEYWKEYLSNSIKRDYHATIGWCFGMEILSLQFVLASLILYILMFMAKSRPETDN